MVGAYVNIFFKNRKLNKLILIGVYLVNTIVLFLLNVYIAKKLGRGWVIYSYNFIIIFVSSIALIPFFKELKIQSKLLNNLSRLT